MPIDESTRNRDNSPAGSGQPDVASFSDVATAEGVQIRERRSQVLPEHSRSHGYLGVALSGGGIRSATLNLGILQGLAQRGLLPYFDYLSTVSGAATSEPGCTPSFCDMEKDNRP